MPIYKCIYVTGVGIGMQNLCISSCEDEWGNRLGTSGDVQASQHDSTVHVRRLFLPNKQADDCDVIIMMSLLYCLHK